MADPEFNCDCDTGIPEDVTLADLRRRLLVRLGYSAQADNPPPGMADLLDDFLSSSQRYLYRKYPALYTERFFTWTMDPDSDPPQRFYDFDDNEEECEVRIDPLRITWAGISDVSGVNDTWLPLIRGIPPEFYTSADRPGIPSRYEVRQCIEVYPAPDRAYKLRLKGHFGLLPFAEDADLCTLDDHLVFTWSLAAAKAHYGQPDAGEVKGEAGDYLKQLVKGAHGTARYVPGTYPVPSATRPLFLDQDS
jgi:hypothetical protein